MKPNNRITNTFTHKSRTCSTSLWNQNAKIKAKYQYTEKKRHAAIKTNKILCIYPLKIDFLSKFGLKLACFTKLQYGNKRAC